MFSKSLGFFPPQANIAFVPTLLRTKPISDNLKRINAHIFNQQLFDGTLSASIFGRYLHDDCIYLHHYALALNKLSSRTVDINPALTQHLNHLAANIISDEKDMQAQFGEYFINTTNSKPGVTISAYIDFLTTNAEKTELPVALCSILPCFWIYYKLGAKKLHPDQLSYNPYKKWIKSYSNPEFVEATTALAKTVDQLAEQSTTAVQSKMKEAFSQAVEFELKFFNEVNPPKNHPSFLS